MNPLINLADKGCEEDGGVGSVMYWRVRFPDGDREERGCREVIREV